MGFYQWLVLGTVMNFVHQPLAQLIFLLDRGDGFIEGRIIQLNT